MPIITCPDCGHHPVSDRAAACPKCGCPIAAPNVSSGSPNQAVAVPGQQDGSQAIAQLESIVKEAQRELLTSDQAEVVARRIADSKRTAFSSRDAFVETSVANRILVLGDEDVDILKSLDADQRLRIKALYALACDRLDGTMLGGLKGFRNLAVLDLSYSSGWTSTEMRIAFSRDVDLSVLQHLYLRRSRRVCSYGIMYWLKQATQLEGLYLDGSTNAELNDDLAGQVSSHLLRKHSLRTLSIQGCSQLASPLFLGAMQGVLERYPQLKMIGP